MSDLLRSASRSSLSRLLCSLDITIPVERSLLSPLPPLPHSPTGWFQYMARPQCARASCSSRAKQRHARAFALPLWRLYQESAVSTAGFVGQQLLFPSLFTGALHSRFLSIRSLPLSRSSTGERRTHTLWSRGAAVAPFFLVSYRSSPARPPRPLPRPLRPPRPPRRPLPGPPQPCMGR